MNWKEFVEYVENQLGDRNIDKMVDIIYIDVSMATDDLLESIKIEEAEYGIVISN